jgi:acyl carrier protein
MDILQQVNDVFKKVFNDSSLMVGRETTANDIEGWDSLSHFALVSAIEITFRIKFSRKEVLTFRDVGELIDQISIKRADVQSQ